MLNILFDNLFSVFLLFSKLGNWKYITFNIRGKLGHTVPVLLHSQLQECIKLLLQHQSNAKVESQNPFLFGILGYDKHRYKHLKTCQLMQDFSSRAIKSLTYKVPNYGNILLQNVSHLILQILQSHSQKSQSWQNLWAMIRVYTNHIIDNQFLN